MKKIVLICSNGMSTSTLVKKMRKAAEETGYECTVDAYPMTNLREVMVDADCILLGPQVSYQLDKVKAVTGDMPLEVIAMQDFGMMNGKKVLEQARRIMKDA
ncbi:MAG: PTS sugar transporter subunit IIB [Erysipelotrichaceae bacterium]|nr:PTS sugar transporter subunit IIB [Erysipelotrichaceae bacterium]